MRRVLILLLGLSASAVAQVAETLPRGFSQREASSYHWAGWNASQLYAPARCTYSYDKSVFPWSGMFEIHRIWLRRDRGAARSFTAHEKRLKIKMSTNGFAPSRPNCEFESNLGADKTYVFGDEHFYRSVQFPALPASGSPATFDLMIRLDRPFVVPFDAQSLQVDFIIESSSAPLGTWYADAEHHDVPLDAGSTEVLASACRRDSRPPEVGPLWPGSSVRVYCATGAPAMPVVGWLGPRLQPAQQFSKTCWFHVAWQSFLLQIASAEPSGTVLFDFGPVPMRERFVGAKLCFQATVLNNWSFHDDVLAATDAIEMTIGGGFPAHVTASSVYSYGPDLTPPDPDTRFRAAFVSSRAIVLGLN